MHPYIRLFKQPYLQRVADVGCLYDALVSRVEDRKMAEDPEKALLLVLGHITVLDQELPSHRRGVLHLGIDHVRGQRGPGEEHDATWHEGVQIAEQGRSTSRTCQPHVQLVSWQPAVTRPVATTGKRHAPASSLQWQH